MTLSDRLKAAIAADHEAIEALPVTRAMFAGRLDRATYLRLVADLEAIHDPLEAELARAPDAVPVYRPDMARAAILRADRAALGGGDAPADPSAEARDLADRVAAAAGDRPWALAGVVYVLEGSRMGSLVLARRLAASLGVPAEPGHGLDYHLDGAAGRPRAWGRFKAELDALPLTPGQQADVVAAAAAAMAGMCRVYAAAAAEPAGCA